MNAFDAAETNGTAADLQRELEALFVAPNTSGTVGATSVAATLLRVTVTREPRAGVRRERVGPLPNARWTVAYRPSTLKASRTFPDQPPYCV